MQITNSVLHLQVAEQYRTGERVGYAEPSPGFELYLLPPGNDTTKLLAEHGHPQNNSDVIGEGEELLMGVVVWRKNQTQSSVPSRPNQSKRAGLSGKSSVSPSPSEAPKSGLTSSRKGSASSAAHVSHGLSMQKHIESDSTTRTPVRDSFRHSPSVTNSLNYQQPVAPLAGVKGAEERSAGVSKESSLASRQQISLPPRRANHDNDLADVPPGFFPGPSPFPFAPDAASRGQSGSNTGAALTFAVPSPLSTLSSHADPRVGSQLVAAKKDDEMVEAPPGFRPRGPQALRPSTPTDEDDLPEFDFGSGSSQRGMLGTGQQVVPGTAELAHKNSLSAESAPNQFGVEVPKEQSLLNSGVPVYPHPAAASRFYSDMHNARDYTTPSPAGSGAYNMQQTPTPGAASVYSQQGVGPSMDQRFLGNQPPPPVNLASLPLAQDLAYLNATGRRDYPAEALSRQGQIETPESLMSRAGPHLPNVGGQSFGVPDAAALQYAARGGVLNQQMRAGALPEWRPQVAAGPTTFQAPRPALSMMNNATPGGVFAAQQQQRFSAVVQGRSAMPGDPAWARGPPQQLLPDAAASRGVQGAAPAVGAVGAQVGTGAGAMAKWQHPNQFQRTIYATRKPVEIKDTAAALRQREILNARDAYPGRSGDPYSANSTRSRDPRKHRRDRSRSRDRGRGRSRSRSRDRGRSRSKDRHRPKDKDKESGRGRDRERDRSRDRSRGRSRSRSRGRSRERSRERSKEKSTERNRERSRERERDRSASPKNSK